MDLLRTAAPWIGYAAAALTVVSYLPQVVRVWRTRHTNDLSRGTFVLLITACALWLTYGILEGDWPIIATNAGLAGLNVAILTAKIRFG